MRPFNTLTGFLLSKSSNPTTDDTVEFQGYDTVGVGASKWQHNGITGQTPSQSPSQLGDALLNDGNGNQWALVPLAGTDNAEVQASSLGVIPDVDKSLEIQACLFAAQFGGGPSGGGVVVFGKGQFLAKELVWPSRVTIKGGGRTVTTLKLIDNADTYLLASSTFINNQIFTDTRHQAESMTFDGNKDNQTSGNGLIITKAYRALFNDVAINNSYSSGIRISVKTANGTLTSAGQAENHYLKSFFNSNNGPGVFADDESSGVIADGVIDGCVFNNNCITEKFADIQLDRAAGWKVLGNQVYGGGFNCLSVSGFARAVVSNNHFDLSSNLATTGDTPAAIHIVGFGGQGANNISNNVLFLQHDGDSSGATPTGIFIDSASSNAL